MQGTGGMVLAPGGSQHLILGGWVVGRLGGQRTGQKKRQRGRDSYIDFSPLAMVQCQLMWGAALPTAPTALTLIFLVWNPLVFCSWGHPGWTQKEKVSPLMLESATE